MQFLQFFAQNGSFSSNCSTHSFRFGMKCSLEEPRTSVQVMCMRNDRLTDQKLGICDNSASVLLVWACLED